MGGLEFRLLGFVRLGIMSMTLLMPSGNAVITKLKGNISMLIELDAAGVKIE